MSIELGTGSTENKLETLAVHVSGLAGAIMVPFMCSKNEPMKCYTEYLKSAGLEYLAIGGLSDELYTPISLANLSKRYLPNGDENLGVSLYGYLDADFYCGGRPSSNGDKQLSLYAGSSPESADVLSALPRLMPTNGDQSSRCKATGFVNIPLYSGGRAPYMAPLRDKFFYVDASSNRDSFSLSKSTGTLIIFAEGVRQPHIPSQA